MSSPLIQRVKSMSSSIISPPISPNATWLKRHRNVRFHYTPTHSSWLNQIEIWFSILAGKSLDGASFQRVPELIAHIDAFIASYNEPARPFVWTNSQVHQKRLKPCFADQ